MESRPCSHEEKKSIVSIKTGTFDVDKISIISGDPFLGKLLDAFLKNTIILVEDSDRRLPVITQIQDYRYILEEISNVNVKYDIQENL